MAGTAGTELKDKNKYSKEGERAGVDAGADLYGGADESIECRCVSAGESRSTPPLSQSLRMKKGKKTQQRNKNRTQ